MKAENRLEFLGAFIIWTLTGFRGKISDHYSREDNGKQIRNFVTGLLTIIIVATSLCMIMNSLDN